MPSKIVHGFQPSFSKPNIVFRPPKADDVELQGVLQVGGDFAEHLIRLDHLDRRAGRIELQGLPQFVNARDVHARHGAAAEIERNAVGLLMVEGGFNALSGIHGEMEG